MGRLKSLLKALGFGLVLLMWLTIVDRAAFAQPLVKTIIIHATDCTAATAEEGVFCYEQDANTLYICEPSAGDCDTAGEWEGPLGDGAGTSLTVEEADGSPSVATVDTIQYDSADGFTVTDETGGNVQVDLLFAKLLNLDGDATSTISGTDGTNVDIDPGDDGDTNGVLRILTSNSDPTIVRKDSVGERCGVGFNTNSLQFDCDGSFSGGFVAELDNTTLRGQGSSSAEMKWTNASSTVPVFVFNSDENTGLGWEAADDVRLIAGGVSAMGATATEVDLYLITDPDAQSETCADDGNGGTAATKSITPTKGYIAITNSDAQGCVVTLSETGATDGRLFRAKVISTAGGTVDFTDSAGVQEVPAALASGCQLNLYGVIQWGYISDRWTMELCETF